MLSGGSTALAALPIDHSIAPARLRGRRDGCEGPPCDSSSRASWPATTDDRNHPDDDATSRLSPYLHFGHVSAHEVFSRGHDARALDDAAPRREARRHDARAGGASRRRQRPFSISSSSGASSPSTGASTFATTPLRVAPGLGANTLEAHAGDPRPHATRSSSSRARDADDRLERGAASARRRRLVPRLPAHALGEEDPRVEPVARRGAQRMEA